MSSQQAGLRRRPPRPKRQLALRLLRRRTLQVREDLRNEAAWADRSQVEAILRREAPGTLACALSADVFAGRSPTRYTRRGHIPGSRLFPARELFEENGRYAAPEVLERRAREALGPAERPLVIYCGGGISAAATALALTLLGEQQIRIYDGSLEEWSADPRLPLQLGE